MTAVPLRQGKVRDLYDLGDALLLVASDRISAFDWILPGEIPDKGRALTQLSAFWFERLGVPHHLLSLDVAADQVPAGLDPAWLRGRSMVVRKCDVVPVECVARGYLAGSGTKAYRATGSVCGIALPPGLVDGSKLPEPIFTPATKAESGHDENIPFEEMERTVGSDLARALREKTLAVYAQGAAYAAERGIVVADTKLEWGLAGDEIVLIDEVLTSDSSRFWPADDWRPGQSQPSFDKQFVRDFLESTGWDKQSTPPPLPADVVAKTRAKYVEAYERLTGRTFEW